MPRHRSSTRTIRPLARGLALAGLVAAAACKDATTSTGTSTPTDVTALNHIVVIYLENHSFDNTYGEYPGAVGLSAGLQGNKQLDSSGNLYTALPLTSDSKLPAGTILADAPFALGNYLSPAIPTRDLFHKYYLEQQQIDGGKMDKFVAYSDAQGLAMGYYHTSELSLSSEALDYVLCDNFFHSAFGGSFLNHFWLIAAATPVFPNAPAALISVLGNDGYPTSYANEKNMTPDGYVVNTSYTVNTPHPSTQPTANLVPNQTMPTIGDRLNDKNISWAWYSGGWNDALAGHPDPLFQFHHQPFAYFANYADGTALKTAHLKDEADFIAAAEAGTLPAVSFVKPLGMNNEHPGYADIITGEAHTEQLINAVRNGPNWKDAAIIITYDEHGGQWDHVAPPKIDRWGPGSRVPAIIISPFAKHGFIDHTQYETVSILALIEKRFGLPALGTRDAAAANLLNAFDFTQKP